MEKIHKLKLYDFCVVKVVFRKKGSFISWGTVILTEKLEFAGHMNNDTLIGFFKDEKFYIVYHMETLEVQSIPFLYGVSAVVPISYDFKIRMPKIDTEFIGRTYESLDGNFEIEFEESLQDEFVAECVLKENKDLFVMP